MVKRSMPVVENGRFHNPPGAPRPECGPGGFAGFVWRRLLDSGKRDIPDNHVWPTQRVLDGIAAQHSGDAITWLGHAAFLLRLANKNILTDPFLSDVAAPWPVRAPRRFAPPALRAKQLPQIDLLLVSHNHYDHCDAPTIKALRERADVPVVVPLGLGDFFNKRGYTQVTELNWWQSCEVGGVKVTAVPAIHFSRRGAGDANKTLWCGFVIEDATGQRVYFAGDTAYGDVFKQIGEAFGSIYYALVPIGAYEPRCIMAGAHVNAEEAAQICADVAAKNAVAMHWGSIVLTEEPAFEPPQIFREAMQARGFTSSAIHIPAIGETLTVAAKNSKEQ